MFIHPDDRPRRTAARCQSGISLKTFEDQRRLRAFDAFKRDLRRPLTTTPYNLPGMSGILGFLDSSDCVHLGPISHLSIALTLKSTGLLVHTRAQRLPLVQLCVNLLLGHGVDTVDEPSNGNRRPRPGPAAPGAAAGRGRVAAKSENRKPQKSRLAQRAHLRKS